MNNLFEQLESMASELPLDKKQLLIKLLNGQVSGQSCLDILKCFYLPALPLPKYQTQRKNK